MTSHEHYGNCDNGCGCDCKCGKKCGGKCATNYTYSSNTQYNTHNTHNTQNTQNPHNNTYNPKNKKLINWPPKETHNDHYGHIYVPGDFNNIQAAVTAIEISQAMKEKRRLYDKDGCGGLPPRIENPKGYVVHLAPGFHTIYTSHVSNLKFLRFQGDNSIVKGVGYFHKVGNWEDYNTFNGEFDTCEGGEAPFNLSVNCDRITVKSCKSPNYNSLKCGDNLMFYHRDGKMTTHQVKSGCNNTIVLNDSIPLKGKCVAKGEGFFIHPNVTLSFCARNCNSQKMLIQHRLEYVGLNLQLANPLITGAHGGHTAVNNSTINGCGPFIHVGKADWSFPNVWTNEMAFNDGTGSSNAMLQSFVGCDAKATFQSNPMANFWFGTFNGNKIGANLKNTGKASFFSSHFHSCDTGALLRHGSSMVFSKSQVSCCKVGVDGKFKSQINAHPIYEDYNLIGDQKLILDSNDLGFTIDNSTIVNLATVFNNNNNDLSIDGDLKKKLNPDYDSGTYGSLNSALFYDLSLGPLQMP